MYCYIILVALLGTALAGSQTCHTNRVQWVSCGGLFENECVSPQIGNGICQFWPNVNIGLCTSPTFECSAGTECYDYSCKVAPGNTCSSSGPSCADGYSCLSGKCKCPLSVPDQGATSCFWSNDALGSQLGLTVCGATNRTCIQTIFDPTNPKFMYGTCVSEENGVCDSNNDCRSGYCEGCKCIAYNPNKLCKHRTAVVKAMQNFEACLSSYTVVPPGPMLESMCDVGVSQCKSHLFAADRYNSGELANKIQAYINNKPTNYNTRAYCSYREEISYRCNLNLVFI